MKTAKIKVKNLFAPAPRAARTDGAGLDLLLPREWPETEAPISWRWRARPGEEQTGQGRLDEIPNPGNATVRVWTPATESLLTRTSLPTRSRAKVEQALPFALEEQLLDDPAQLHFAWRREEDNTVYVAVTGKTRIESWLAALERAGIKPTTLCPATLALPWSPDCWSAAFVGDELIVRTGPVSGFTCVASAERVPDLLVTHIKNIPATSRPPEYFIAFNPPSGFSADAWSSTLGVPVRVEAQSFWKMPGDSEPALNLLQGVFAPKGELNRQLRPWLPAAIMLSVWLIGSIIFDGIEWFRLYRAHKENVREMESLLLSAFPETKVIIDPAQQMQKSFDTLQARSGLRPQDMLPMLARATRAWQSAPPTKLRSINYGDRSLTFKVSATDAQAIESLRGALQSSGLSAEIVSTTPRASEVEGTVRIQAPESAPAAKSPGTKS